jgi:virginiamycin A acetyltransferase
MLRWAIKRILFFGATALVAPLIAIARIESRLSARDIFFLCFGEGLSLIPGPVGCFLRLAYYWGTLQNCSKDVVFSFGTKINRRGTEIGNFVVFGTYCNVGLVTIGDQVLIGSRVCIPSGGRQHDVHNRRGNLTDAEPIFERVAIGSNVWIGEGSIVLSDIGDECVVSAGSVVFRSVPHGATAMGNPARIIARHLKSDVDDVSFG